VDKHPSVGYLAPTMSSRSDSWPKHLPARAGYGSFDRGERITLGTPNAPRS
jgi:hypothetical protein